VSVVSDSRDPDSWLPPNWSNPIRVELPTGHHLRPIRSTDVDLHVRAVLDSREGVGVGDGGGWAWPPPEVTIEQDRRWLALREAAAAQHWSFTYALFDLGETELLGCVDLDPDPTGQALGLVRWWVVDWLVDSPVERALDELVPAWMAADWPLWSAPGVTGWRTNR
jgi:hypothetical protein